MRTISGSPVLLSHINMRASFRGQLLAWILWAVVRNEAVCASSASESDAASWGQEIGAVIELDGLNQSMTHVQYTAVVPDPAPTRFLQDLEDLFDRLSIEAFELTLRNGRLPLRHSVGDSLDGSTLTIPVPKGAQLWASFSRDSPKAGANLLQTRWASLVRALSALTGAPLAGGPDSPGSGLQGVSISQPLARRAMGWRSRLPSDDTRISHAWSDIVRSVSTRNNTALYGRAPRTRVSVSLTSRLVRGIPGRGKNGLFGALLADPRSLASCRYIAVVLAVARGAGGALALRLSLDLIPEQTEHLGLARGMRNVLATSIDGLGLVQVQRTAERRGLIGSLLQSYIKNTHCCSALDVGVMDMIPGDIAPYFSTFAAHVECPGQDRTPAKLHNLVMSSEEAGAPGPTDVLPPAKIEFEHRGLGPGCALVLDMSVRSLFLTDAALPSDPARGVHIPGFLVHARVACGPEATGGHCGQWAMSYSHDMLLPRVYPDRAMPFNVMPLVAALLAIFVGLVLKVHGEATQRANTDARARGRCAALLTAVSETIWPLA